MKFYILNADCDFTEDAVIESADAIYRSRVFDSAREFVSHNNLMWLIASPVHGLVWPNMQLKPYPEPALDVTHIKEDYIKHMPRELFLNMINSFFEDNQVHVSRHRMEFVICGDTPSLRAFHLYCEHNYIRSKTPLFDLDTEQQIEWFKSQQVTFNAHL
mgnify:CR=1 FL=1